MTPSEQMRTRLRALGLTVPEGATIRRTYAGINQRQAGAWSWYVALADGAEAYIGSQHPLSTLLRGRISATSLWRDQDIHIDPVDPRDPGEPVGAYSLYLVEPERT